MKQKEENSLHDLLPFAPRPRGDWSSWVYDHRYGITISVLTYFIIAFLFLSVRIPLIKYDTGGILVDMERESTELQKLVDQEQQLREQASEGNFREVRNLASNDGSMREMADGEQSMGSQAAEMAAQAREMAERLSSSREAYEEGLAAADAIRNAERMRGENSRQADNSVKQTGEVTVRYTLENRHHTYLHIPAYQCEGGGEVVVNILVNQSGVVVSASAVKGAATSCHTEMAVKAAQMSRFNADTDAPERQQGTITYIFIPQ